ncbi:MAG TPA: hypothetical protein VK541_03270 [Pedobacter sp.]|uniref:hypothetical protein n=1 Tax=Pedobacter sp. TaxID=1411316 RepID=UPI002D0E63DB|nr:hypothetical protein [Pedobacter sp.]HMI01472.1 hypothetical protein [Pedobacter sp.]
MLEDYKKAVVHAYHRKKEIGELSLNLSHPTPRKVKNECLIVLRSRTQKKDEPFIRDFFNSGVESNDYSHSITRFDVDKFRPLIKFLRKQTEDTDDKNIELLAWLIDFEERPYKFGVDYDKIRPKPLVPTSPIPPPIIITQSNPMKRKVIVSITIIVLSAGGIYLSANSSTKVYICERGTGKKYHINAKCPALKNCDNGAIQTTIAAAEKNGKTRCLFEP